MSSTILIVEDDFNLQEALQDTLHLAGFSTQTATDGYSALNMLSKLPIDMVISDVQMSGMDGHKLLKEIKCSHPEIPMLLMTAYADIANAVQAIQDGAIDYLVKPFDAKQLVKTIKKVVGAPEVETDTPIAISANSCDLFNKAKKVAHTDATVLISGESGTGKEVLARFIHQKSTRTNKPFMAINCAAIPENMLEATLFGYEKGAFTGAYQASAGKFEQAHTGTILLDEITEMELGLQAKLLRVLQEREIERLGGKKTFKLDVRVIATSNRDLKKAVEKGDFREDLYYRLNVFPLHAIALRERVEDIIPIAEYLVQHHTKKMQVADSSLSTAAKNKLLHYQWPGNVRELDNVMQRALILKTTENIEEQDIQFENDIVLSQPIEKNTLIAVADVQKKPEKENLKQREYALISDELRAQNGCRKKTAEQLGISPRTLRYKLAKMRELGMDIPSTNDLEA